VRNTGVDGYLGNRLGLWNTVGDVWEWCADRFGPDLHADGPRIDPASPPNGVGQGHQGRLVLLPRLLLQPLPLRRPQQQHPGQLHRQQAFRCASDA
jgi:formylglycine-generating enzyme required for sulfatase activity